jgi:hypothetical protein
MTAHELSRLLGNLHRAVFLRPFFVSERSVVKDVEAVDGGVALGNAGFHLVDFAIFQQVKLLGGEILQRVLVIGDGSDAEVLELELEKVVRCSLAQFECIRYIFSDGSMSA